MRRRRRRPHHHHHHHHHQHFMASTFSAPQLLPFLLLLCFASIAPPLSALASDLQHLLSFKSSLPNPAALPTWIPSADPCSSFAGISCSGASRVSSIHLDSAPLDIDLHHVLSYLLSIDSLVSLSLRSTNLTGSLSTTVARCGGELEEVDLSGNGLRGSITDVPMMFAACSGLRTLNLSGNGLGFAPEQPALSGFPVGLEALDLSFNKVSGGSVLSWVFLAGSGLRYLDLSGNTLSGAVPVVGNCSLQHLDLSSNELSEITAVDGRNEGGAFADCETLSFLNLSTNHFSGALPPDLLGDCRTLLHLDLSSNNFSGAIPPSLSLCAALESINLSSNNFSGDLPLRALTAMTRLRRLEFGYNGVAGTLESSFLSSLPYLELLDLSSNSLSGSIPPDLCGGPSSGANLKELYLQNNLLTGSIPSSIGNCSMLVSLDLSFNYLTGRLPTSLGELSSLKDLIAWQNALEGPIPAELGKARYLENLFLDNNGLTGSIPDGLANCINLNWISLSSNRLTGSIPSWIGMLSNLAILKIGNNSLSGPIPPEIGDCKSLIWLDLNSNHLNGSIPPTLAKQSGKIAVGMVTGKRYVYLRNDGSSECHGAGNLLEFAGIRQEELGRLPTSQSCNFTRRYVGSTRYVFNNNGSMTFLDLSYNSLSGTIPPELGVMYYLNVLDLGHNFLSGVIPPELGGLKSIGVLDLSHNELEGPIPASFSGLSLLTEFYLSNNHLNGSIPDVGQLGTFPPYWYENNTDLCGFPLPPCGSNSNATGVQRQGSLWRRASLVGGVTLGILVPLLLVLAAVVSGVEYKKRQRRKNGKKAGDARDVFVDSWSQSGVTNSRWKMPNTREALSVTLATFDSKPLRKLTFADLVAATNGFDDGALVGSGGFGDVYKAQLKDGSVVAIKKLIHVSGQGEKEFMAEMETIGRVKHRNLVPLLGYCRVDEERLLVYEYMKYGSLEDVLHDRKKLGIRLNWSARRRIAVGAARGLAFLHHSCIPHIIHRDMKSSNVLLDDELEARVSDFGMARVMNAADTHLSVSTLAGTPGYVPPEYYQSFRCSTKGDVYSYGVVLLELLTGKRPTNASDFGENNNLVGWVKQHSKLRISDLFDQELLKDDPSLELELLQHLKIACACLDDRPSRRPTMLRVMALLKEIQADSPVDSTASVATAGSMDSGFGSFGMVEMSLKEGAEEKD